MRVVLAWSVAGTNYRLIRFGDDMYAFQVEDEREYWVDGVIVMAGGPLHDYRAKGVIDEFFVAVVRMFEGIGKVKNG